MALNIIIVEKTGVLKSLAIKEFKEDELFKKCGFKKADDFIKQHEWSMKTEGKKYYINVYAKIEGRPNSENKYDFPPPIDTTLFFGTCALIRLDKTTGKIISLTEELWSKVYDKLFGGFEDIGEDDEYSEDELEQVKKDLKTKNGYLKDGFVIEDDISGTDDNDDEEDDEEDEEEDDEQESEITVEVEVELVDDKNKINNNEYEEETTFSSNSELEEEDYIYSDEE